MKTKLIIGLMSFIMTLTFSSLSAQITLENGDYFSFAGDYKFEDAGTTYDLNLFGTEGEFEGELKCKSLFTDDFTMTVTAKFEDTDYGYYACRVYFDKLTSGKCTQVSKFKAEAEQPVQMFLLIIHHNDKKINQISTITDHLVMDGIDEQWKYGIHFIKAAGTSEGPP